MTSVFSITPVGILEQNARSKIEAINPALLSIKYQLCSYIPFQYKDVADGAYDQETSTVYLCRSAPLRTAVHELGHAVHWQLFDAQDFGLDPLYDNHREDFAELFADIVLGQGRHSADRYDIEEMLRAYVKPRD